MHPQRDQMVNLSLAQPGAMKVVGMARDFGTCKGQTKNGEKCRAIVNTYVFVSRAIWTAAHDVLGSGFLPTALLVSI